MINDRLAVIALRNRLLTAQFVTTGNTTLGATGTGFTRPAGSFIDDGFTVGMEVVPTGFVDNSPGVIKSVTATTIEIYQSRSVEADGAGRTLDVGIPVIQGWENTEYNEEELRWYIEEDYLPGPKAVATFGHTGGTIEHTPMYVLRLGGIPGLGISALSIVADGVLDLFPPNFTMMMDDGQTLRVRTFPAPSRGQILPRAGRAEVAVTIPLIARTRNII